MMKISTNKVVELSYTLKVDGQIADQATVEHPLDYIQGCHMLLPRFEEAVEGLEQGDSFSFSISPEDGYGVYEEDRCFDIPKSSFEYEGKLREDLLIEGRIIPLLNGAGQVCHARIIEIRENDVKVDFNHPMAGKTLFFTGEILSVREATEKELAEGLHGEFLPPEGGCCHHGKGGCCHHGEGHGDECHCHEEGHECHCHEH